MEALERRVAELEARVTIRPEPSGSDPDAQERG